MASLRRERDSNKAGDSVARVFEFDAPMPVGDETFVAKMIVLEMERGEQGRRLYTVSAVEIEREKEARVKRGEASETQSVPPAGFTHSFGRKLAAVKGQTSKVVDENGEPLVVYKAMYPYDWRQATLKDCDNAYQRDRTRRARWLVGWVR